MKIYTKVVWQWVGDNLVQVEEQSYEYDGPVDLLKGGGGSTQEVPEELKSLYKFQEEQGRYLMEQFKGQVAPAYSEWGQTVRGLNSDANKEQEAGRAISQAGAAFEGQRQALEQNLASMGVDPSDARYAKEFNKLGIQSAAAQAQAGTNARSQLDKQYLAGMQDFVGMGMGTPTQATSAINAAANNQTNAWNASIQNQNMAAQQQANSIGAMARLGTNAMGWTGNSGVNFTGADGGIVHLQNGGYVQRLAAGGIAGGRGLMGSTQVQAPPPMGGYNPNVPSPGMAAAQGIAGAIGPGQVTNIGKGVGKLGTMMESPGMSQFGQGIQAGAKAPLETLRNIATNQVDKTLGTTQAVTPTATGATDGLTAAAAAGGEDAAAAAAAEEAAAAAAAEEAAAQAAAATAAETTGAMTAGATLGAAVPIIGGGLALYGIGNAAGWWADGGKVTPGSNGQGGGEVSGPGGPKDDLIHAALSDGEFVMPRGVVLKFGLERLEKMRQAGLEYEKQMGISR